jgi:hypothetical protein
MSEARSYSYPVQYEVRVRVNVNAKTPEEAVREAQKLLAKFPACAEIVDPRGGVSRIDIGVIG